MSGAPLSVGYVALVDAAPYIIAHELGFADEQGLSLELQRAPSWATLRDWLAMGTICAAHMLSPVPVAVALGATPASERLDALMVTSVNGNVIGVRSELAQQMRAAGHSVDFSDARAAGEALMATGGRLRVGVPFPFSMHAELVYHWLGALGVTTPQGLDVKTVPPPLMADAVAAGEIDAFCVGAPWGSLAVETGVGELILPSAAIWSFAPEKVLAVRHSWAEGEPELAKRLMRAIYNACRWLALPENRATAAEIMTRAEYLDLPVEIIERSLRGRLIINARGDERACANHMCFHRGAATFPWKSQAEWMAARIAARLGLDRASAMAKAAEVFRTDLYRANLAGTGAEMPAASRKVEGALSEPSAVASASGKLILERDAFFDGTVFDPSAAE
ncbi:Nitrate transport protein NrtA precursor [Aquimixticola soesokkakensis]|uniref:Nitrate transport protein NrtA n=1 Tax=Aquimixticola soesokkakensis TaxID=1519096 RepID=A0A1Y5STJ8_9RHOB|nr:CmpA/NrtA family ABC transporter substrate-binding protein [Aquimixticola soesokkakensis]SLN44762.1 Nitrate transport protein NrtA precursor [Aquimixticola soesokkakensis]